MDNPKKIARALRGLSMETGSLACLGCGHEHNCSTYGCAILRDAADLIVELNDFDQTQSKIALERCQKVEAQLAAAQQTGNRMAKAFVLLCRVLDDFVVLAPCQICKTDWPECNGESEQCGDRPIWQCWQKYILERVDAEPVCRVCGCTQDNACPGGCYWVAPDLCSACAEAGKEKTDE